MAIVHPLNKCFYNKRSLLATIWIVGIAFATSQLFISKSSPYTLFQYELFECVEVWPKEIYGQIYTIIVFIITFLLPVLIITFTYSKIWYQMMHQVTPGNPDLVRDTHRIDVRNKAVKMLIIVVALFILCWSPIHLFNVLLYFAPSIMNIETELMFNLYYISFFTCHFLAMVHSLMNPIVYCFMSENFRVIFTI